MLQNTADSTAELRSPHRRPSELNSQGNPAYNGDFGSFEIETDSKEIGDHNFVPSESHLHNRPLSRSRKTTEHRLTNIELEPLHIDSHGGDLDVEEVISQECWCCNMLNVCGFDDNVFVLVILFVATTSFTVAQFTGAVYANSLSMYGDCATMALDSLTYLLNIYCEKTRIAGSTEAVRLEVGVATISIAALTVVTIFLLWDSIQRLMISGQALEDLGEVNADIMLEFSVTNFIIDIFSCSVFISKLSKVQLIKSPSKKKAQRTKFDRLSSNELELYELESDEYNSPGSESKTRGHGAAPGHGSHGAGYSLTNLSSKTPKPTKDVPIPEHRNLNMASAFLHLGADTLRTLTVMITALIVDLDKRGVNSVDADAIGSIVVCVIILAVVIALGFELVGLTMALSSSDALHFEAFGLNPSGSIDSESKPLTEPSTLSGYPVRIQAQTD